MKFKPTSSPRTNHDPEPRANPDASWPRSAKSHPVSRLACALLGLSAILAPTQCVLAAAPATVVSMNLCTDQLLVALADPGQIAALSRFSRYADMSFVAPRASRWPALKSGAEQILELAPDLVLAGAFSGGATRRFLESRGVRVETFVPPRNLAEAQSEIDRAARLLGREKEGQRLQSDIDAALQEASRAAVPNANLARLPQRPRTFALERRGYVSGRQTLLSDLMQHAGLDNVALGLSVSSISRISMETIIKSRPDALIIESLGPASTDQGAAFLRHPALSKVVPASRHIAVPAPELTCAGPALPRLIRRLAREAGRVRALLAN
jgi:iron complex transport system substrate-binding protein